MFPIGERCLNFTVDEFKQRMDKVKGEMIKRGMHVLILRDPANLYYLSGFDGWSFYTTQVLIVFIDQEQPVWIGRAMDQPAAQLTTWLDDENIGSYPESYVQTSLKHPMEIIAKAVKERGYGSKVIGTEKDSYYFTAKDQEVLQSVLFDAKFVDATNLVNWVRMVKSETELEYMRIAGGIMEKGIEAVEQYVKIGNRQCDAAAELYKALIKGTPEHGGEYAAFNTIMEAGVRSIAPHLSWTDEVFHDGEMVTIETAGVYKRYHCPCCRSVALGNVPKEAYDVEKAVVEGMSAALDAVKPGVLAEDIEKIWQAVIKKHGYTKESRLAYCCGLNYPPDWGEHTASIRMGDRTVLQEGMTMHMVPSIWLPDQGFGVEISEPFIVTKNGAEPLNGLKRALIKN